MKKIKQATLAALANIESCNRALAAFEFIRSFVFHRDRRRYWMTDQESRSMNAVYSTLMRFNLEAYQHLMFVAQFADDETRKVARKMSYERFVDDGASPTPRAVMWMLEPDGEQPSSYLGTDAEELRAELKAALEERR